MWIVSPDLKRALITLSQKNLGEKGYIKTYGGLNEMDAPYNFLYQHYQELLPAATKSPALQALTTFIEENYKAEYVDADTLFTDGLLTLSHIGKLFLPNTVLIDRDKENQAVMLTESVLTEPGVIYLRGWYWQLNGTAFSRTNWNGSLSSLGIQSNE